VKKGAKSGRIKPLENIPVNSIFSPSFQEEEISVEKKLVNSHILLIKNK